MSDEPVGTALEFHTASFRAVQSPEACTPRDFEILNSTFEGRALAARARTQAAAHAAKADEAQRRTAAKPAGTKPAARTAIDLILDGTLTAAWKSAIGGDGTEWERLIATHAYVPVTLAAMDLLIGQATFLHHQQVKTLTAELAAVKQELAAAKQQLAEVAARPEIKYLGVWDGSTLYGAGAMVTDHGSIWSAKSASIARRPGTDPSAWVLACKAGRDGKDAR